MNKPALAICGMLIAISTLFSAELSTKAADIQQQIDKSVLIEEGFEGSLIPPTGWTIVDADSDGHNWRYDQQFAHHNGLKAISSESYSSAAGALTPDNFLITPPITIPADMMGRINYWVSAQSGGWNYEHYSVMISTTGTSPADFTTTLFEETITAKDSKDPSIWHERNVGIPWAYSGQTVYIAFRHYNTTDMFALNVDDVKIYTDFGICPFLFGPVTGTPAAIDTAMNISVAVWGYNGISSVVGHYKLSGQTIWSDFTMTPGKEYNTYFGTIPAQTNAITGYVKFTATDNYIPASSSTSPEYDIAWVNNFDAKWLEWGENYDSGSGVGLALPWWAGVDFDFGSSNEWRLTKIKLGIDALKSVPWSVRSVSQTNPYQIAIGDTIGNLFGTINCVSTSDTIPTIASVTDTLQTLTGHLALIFKLPGNTFVTRDKEAGSSHTYISMMLPEGWMSTLTMQSPNLTGAWLMGIYVSKKSVGIEETAEILPGSSQLKQNYPNPFNPSTAISFYNNMSGKVRLTVLNAKGETVATLINSQISAGNHQTIFDGSNLNSGVYFYRLETPTATITKKMLLVK